MSHPSRLTRTAHALVAALTRLGDALVHVDYDAVASSEAAVRVHVHAFRTAADGALTTGDVLSATDSDALAAALARCRRLGGSLMRLTGVPASLDTPRGYSPVGQVHAPVDGGAYLTARG